MYNLNTIPMNKEWKDRIKDKWWAISYKDTNGFTPVMKEMLKLRDRLLSMGGEEACFIGADPDLYKILNRGQLHIIKNLENIEAEFDADLLFNEGEPCGCHVNSAKLWKASKQKNLDHDFKIMTGYALTEDGMWRQHSWCVMENKTNGDKFDTIIETTVERIAYFGFKMTENEMNDFVKFNY